MYKIVMTHEVLPGKLAAMKAWFKKQDDARRQSDAAYVPFKRFITVFGNAHQVTIEIEQEKMAEEPWVYAESASDSAQQEFLGMIVPGRTELRVLKSLD